MVAAWRNLFKHNFGVNFHFYLSACECFTGLQISTREKNRTLDSPGHTVLYFVCLVLINYRHFPLVKYQYVSLKFQFSVFIFILLSLHGIRRLNFSTSYGHFASIFSYHQLPAHLRQTEVGLKHHHKRFHFRDPPLHHQLCRFLRCPYNNSILISCVCCVVDIWWTPRLSSSAFIHVSVRLYFAKTN